MTSYRGVESFNCFGSQLDVEPACGLCDYHKPNRLLGVERKRIIWVLLSGKTQFLLIGCFSWKTELIALSMMQRLNGTLCAIMNIKSLMAIRKIFTKSTSPLVHLNFLTSQDFIILRISVFFPGEIQVKLLLKS